MLTVSMHPDGLKVKSVISQDVKSVLLPCRWARLCLKGEHREAIVIAVRISSQHHLTVPLVPLI